MASRAGLGAMKQLDPEDFLKPSNELAHCRGRDVQLLGGKGKTQVTCSRIEGAQRIEMFRGTHADKHNLFWSRR